MSVIRVDYQSLDVPDSSPIVTVQQLLPGGWATVVSEQVMSPIPGLNAFYLDSSLILPNYDYFYSVSASFSSGNYITAGEVRVEDVVDAVWNEMMTDHSITGSAGQLLTIAATNNTTVLSGMAAILAGLASNGNGSILVSDRIIDCNGRGVENVRVQAFAIADLHTPVGTTRTNSDGIWVLALDAGTYLLTIEGCGDPLNLQMVVTSSSVTFTCSTGTSTILCQ